MKIFAFYLPQFHEIDENNRWWGDGFTEWTNVKKAQPLFHGHQQPKIPLDGIYYDLLDKSTIIKQTSLMHQYHVDGLIYYHYYFNGKLLLEKPAENLLEWKDINQSFFFCWANHSWKKTWNGSQELLQEQTYGKKEDWEKHFSYLLPFFQDSRYEKRNNKPVFMIFFSDFIEKKEMFSFFDYKCRENGFAGISLIETYTGNYLDTDDYQKFVSNMSECSEKIFFREMNVANKLYIHDVRNLPFRMRRLCKKVLMRILKKQYLLKAPADLLYRAIRDQEPYAENIIHGMFFEWDNTPRHGYNGHVITSPSKNNFFKTMDKLSDNEYVFFNAWNEWAEGMIMEPTKECEFTYLEWISEWRRNKM